MPSSHLPFFEGRQGCWRFSRDSAENLIDGGDGAIPTTVGSAWPSNRTSPFFEGGHGCPKLNAQRL